MEDQIFQNMFFGGNTHLSDEGSFLFSLQLLRLCSFFAPCSFRPQMVLAVCLPYHRIRIKAGTDEKTVITGSLLRWGWVDNPGEEIFSFAETFMPNLAFLTGISLAASSCQVPAKPL